ncbi:MAG TPA: (2Fe-2S) ferredoxin domain-containing protein [Candidatus Hydrogenedentes bacterium]|nr:(2Fe-2S) ferredoxin domain-containing protein [Candidatus Hydrogenedentota bacterium]HOV60540.1 (2Fe-2S) ferredoxin domain-containing protein [Candidatus Hydrogenedentota bacterium]
MNHPKQITLCAGSACWARGNRENLCLLESLCGDLLGDSGIRLAGCHCQNMCQDGPIIYVDGKRFCRVTSEWLETWVRQWMNPTRKAAP